MAEHCSPEFRHPDGRSEAMVVIGLGRDLNFAIGTLPMGQRESFRREFQVVVAIPIGEGRSEMLRTLLARVQAAKGTTEEPGESAAQ